MASEDEFIEAPVEFNGYDDNDDEDGYEQEFKHKGLLDKISTLNLPEKIRRNATRNEPRDIHEFNLLKTNQGKVNLHQLSRVIKGASTNETVGKIKKVARRLSTKKVLDKPLEKVHQDRISRSVFYENASKEVARWEPIVLQNRVADQLEFPLKQPNNRIDTALELSKKFKPKSDLEKEIQQILDSSENFLDESTAMTEAEEKALKAMSIEEARSRHQELRKTRALLSYREAKLHRQNKIKSKAYRRMLKRDRLRKSVQEFEEMKQKDPTKALEKLQELEKIRIQERASLKHLSTGKWAKMNKIRAKYDKEARDKLAEQLNLNQDLVRRLYEESEKSDDESEDEERKLRAEKSYESNQKNPLMNFVSDRQIINEGGYKEGEDQMINADFFERNYNDLREKMNIELLQKDNLEGKKQRKQEKRLDKKSIIGEKEGHVQENSDEEDEDEMAEEERYKQLVSEALADDDVIEEFHKDKQNTINAEKGKDKDNFLPGWGSWGGAGVKVKSKVRRKYIEKAPKVYRKDKGITNVIISEKKDQVIAKYLPKTLPAGVTDKKSYEKKVVKPIGSTWNPETVFKNIVRPSVVTKLGKKIDPMDESVLAKAKRLYDKKHFSNKLNKIIQLH